MVIFGIQVTQSNLAIFFGLLTALVLGLMTLYWRGRQFWFDREQAFLRHVQETIAAANSVQTAHVQQQLDAQTAQIENCIHQTPGHPENSTASQNSNDKPENQANQ